MTRVEMLSAQAWTFARLPIVLAAHDITAGQVLHIGAHHGEEVSVYRSCGFTAIRLVEPDPDNLAVLVTRFGNDPDIDIVAAAVADVAGTAPLHRAARSVWSGLRPHPTASGDTVTVATLTMALVQAEEHNLLVLDTQGSELALLCAADLRHLDLIIVETTRRPDDSAALYDHTVAYMDECGWQIAEEWVHDQSGYHDSVFVRR